VVFLFEDPGIEGLLRDLDDVITHPLGRQLALASETDELLGERRVAQSQSDSKGPQSFIAGARVWDPPD
jgi:hypothetical protein